MAMIEAGKEYQFTTIDREGRTTWRAHVVEVDGNLIRVHGVDGELIYNTACSSFQSAKEFKPSETKGVDLADLVGLTNRDKDL